MMTKTNDPRPDPVEAARLRKVAATVSDPKIKAEYLARAASFDVQSTVAERADAARRSAAHADHSDPVLARQMRADADSITKGAETAAQLRARAQRVRDVAASAVLSPSDTTATIMAANDMEETAARLDRDTRTGTTTGTPPRTAAETAERIAHHEDRARRLRVVADQTTDVDASRAATASALEHETEARRLRQTRLGGTPSPVRMKIA